MMKYIIVALLLMASVGFAAGAEFEKDLTVGNPSSVKNAPTNNAIEAPMITNPNVASKVSIPSDFSYVENTSIIAQLINFTALASELPYNESVRIFNEACGGGGGEIRYVWLSNFHWLHR